MLPSTFCGQGILATSTALQPWRTKDDGGQEEGGRMSIANLIEANASELGEPVETVIFGYVMGDEFTQEIEKMIGREVSWSDVRDMRDVPFDTRHLPPIRADTKNWSLVAIKDGNGWRMIRFARPRAR
jgi:hypothetical protein